MTNKNEIPYEYSDYVLKKYFHETGIKQGWLPENNKSALIAISGGGDSVALLWLFKKFYKGTVFAIHVNHGIRDSEADDDEEFVKNFAVSLGVPIMSIKINVPSEKLKGESLETAARRLRLQNILKGNKNFFHCENIFLGHNRDDLAETVLFNILRGTGIRGSVGITESSEIEGIKFYRPLLGLRREFLREILRVRNISWHEDCTNSDTKYTRNFIRLKLLPRIEKKINSAAVDHLADFGEEMRHVRENENLLSEKLFNIAVCGEGYIFDRKTLKSLTENEISLIIREAGRRLNLKTLSRRRCSEIVKLILNPENFIFQWCKDVTIEGKNGKITFNDERRNL